MYQVYSPTTARFGFETLPTVFFVVQLCDVNSIIENPAGLSRQEGIQPNKIGNEQKWRIK